MAIKYWGKIVDDYSAMRWPAPSDYHVPSKDEWTALCGILTGTFWLASNDTTVGTYLKMPMAGSRNHRTATLLNQGNRGDYWSSTTYSTGYAYYLYFYSSTLNSPDGALSSQNGDRRARGNSVRCFKDTPITPDSSWTTLYDWSSVATWAGVYHNSSLWLISVSWDGQTWITIQDKNLWATTVWNSWDTLSEANCWKYYQWGNNYWFAWTWTLTTSSTQVNSQNYWPWNYYSSSTFITWSDDWSSVQNDDLWWWETWVQQKPVDLVKRYYGWKMINDVQWPAPYRFHIPTVDEWEWLYDIMSWLYLSSWEDWQENLHMPLASYRTSSGDIYQYPDMWVYWSSSPNTNSQNNAYCLDIRHNNVWPNVSTRRSYWLTVRAFSDSYIEATSDWTVINWDIWYPWIFWNQSEWLITISDWTRWYTIMDKNLWATTVYNYWDVLTDANVGYMYQWWNNYWFPATWTISKTSSTQVDASTYWPNTDNWYYSSDTFITWSYDWSSVHNNNLWWWVTKWHHPAEVKKVYYWWTLVDDYSAMRWPCPEGFHVPMISEWQWINTIMTWLNISDGNGWNRYLKLPFAWYVDYDGFVTGVRNDGYYLTCSPYQSNLVHKIYINYYDTLNISYTDEKGWANSIRPFKDTFVEPTASWTVLAWTLGDAWIFYNATLWLISITPDWTPWYTIADKNLWATAVYNQWDTLTDDNCGYFYQWWNNYWFTWNVITTTSSTQVDASWYWPWNYYSSDIFITWNQDWSSVPNDNLRWWETGIQQSPALIREDNS